VDYALGTKHRRYLMSRTWKRYTGSCFRSPRGHRQALVAGVRKRAIPPDSWEDVSFDKQVFLPQRVADALASKKGMSYNDIVQHVMRKFKLRLGDAEWMAESAVWYRYIHRPKGLLVVYEECPVA
jgi:hypothetical protein